MARNVKIIWDIIEREGGFVDHPDDRGGPTKYGITQQTLSMWSGRPISRQDVKDLTKQMAYRIYESWYGFPEIDDYDLCEAVTDAAVHHGKHTATKWLQEITGSTPDGIWGPNTLDAVMSYPANRALARFQGKRIRHMGRIVDRDHSQAVFIEGWLNRATKFLERI